jgi:replicative DNA helicase
MAERLLEVSPDLAFPQDAVTQTFAILAVRRAGKALALDTKVPTPDGWATMGELKVGDKVFDEKGEPCTVIDAWPVLRGRSCFEVAFSDGSTIIADAGHQWVVKSAACRRADARDRVAPGRLNRRAGRWQCERQAWPEILTTEHLATQLAGTRGHGNTYSVPVPEPLQCPNADLPIPPYTLGAWLGDGAAATGSVTSADPEIIAEITAEGETTWVIPSTVKANHASYRIKRLQPRLGALGLLGNKSPKMAGSSHSPTLGSPAPARRRPCL